MSLPRSPSVTFKYREDFKKEGPAISSSCLNRGVANNPEELDLSCVDHAQKIKKRKHVLIAADMLQVASYVKQTPKISRCLCNQN
jgi:hypothetical protein